MCGYIPYERAEQALLVEWLAYRGLTAVHIPNGGKKSVIGHMIDKSIGERAGFPDLIIINRPPANQTARVYIELKRRRGGRQSDAQKGWEKSLTLNGDYYVLGFGADDAIVKINKLGLGWKL